jgi:hypothetical protein
MFDNVKDFAIIEQPYLIVVNIPYFVDAKGRALFERGWHRDLIQHLHYLRNVILAAPLCPLPVDTDTLVPLEGEHRARLRLVPLPSPTSRIRALVQLIPTYLALWTAVGQVQIVHAGIVGWPYPFGWLASLIAKLRPKKLLIILESAPWRKK